MGVVYSAYDPDLDRRVAIKILHPRSRAATAGSEEGKLRLLREAKALARLSHPNVVAIHDVGTIGSRVFLAMEFVDGATLGAWLKAAPRGWREVLKVLIAAGEGLHAAHTAGLVHRDFKPENVSLGADERVRVLDFGLARAAATEGSYPETAASGPAQEQSASVDLHITSTGVMVGTPAYMSPEQHLGRAADARSDQFAFCVTLYQALYGERPFAGDNVSALQASVIQNKIRPARPGSRVPKWLRKAILRGLAVDPDARYRSMDELLARLRGDPSKRIRRLMALVAVPALLLGVAVGTFGHPSESPCAAPREQIEEVWNPKVRDELRSGFLATKLPNAEATWESAERLLGDYTREWGELRREACEATLIHKAEPAEIYELKTACLKRRRTEFEALVKILGAASPTVVGHALEAIADLAPIAECADGAALRETSAEPRALAVREKIADARRAIADARAHDLTGQPVLARQFADKALELAEELDYAPLRAEARIAVATFHDREGDHQRATDLLKEAIRLAADSRHDEALVLAWIERLQSVAVHQPGDVGALYLADSADAALRRSRSHEGEERSLLRARLDLGIATAQQHFGHYREARERAAEALETLEAKLGRKHPQSIRGRIVIGLAKLGAGDHEGARAAFTEAGDDARALAGEGPTYAVILLNLAEVARQTHRLEEALGLAERSLRILERVDRSHLAPALEELANIEHDLGRLDDAEAHFNEALRRYEEAPGDYSSKRGGLFNNLAFIDGDRGDYAAARRHLEQAHTLLVKSLGPQHPIPATTEGNLAEMLLRLGEREKGVFHLDHSASALRLHESERDGLANMLLTCGELLREQGDPVAAERHLEEALVLLEASTRATLAERAAARLAVARVLAARPEIDAITRARARDLALAALADLPADDEASRAAAEALIASLR